MDQLEHHGHSCTSEVNLCVHDGKMYPCVHDGKMHPCVHDKKMHPCVHDGIMHPCVQGSTDGYSCTSEDT
jgi:hypothetical protein